MKIAILGAGNVGAALARAWTRSNHEVVFGVREPSSAKTLAALKPLGTSARAASLADAVRGADVVVLATPWDATQAALAAAGSLVGKVVVDCTNPLKSDLSGLAVGHTSSGGELVAGWAPGASVFKAFNQTGAENMAAATRFAAAPVMFVCGDDEAKKPVVLQLARDAGFEAVDAGKLQIARLLEPLAMLWIHLAYPMKHGRDFAFALVRPVRG
ncbi:MAG: NADPH-dependent F420 reductase [Planctomycetes bacterium]|nr:NADPH-dependent F420 reductase [Planctomycetota bacterium]